jgi:hypothetical protein
LTAIVQNTDRIKQITPLSPFFLTATVQTQRGSLFPN